MKRSRLLTAVQMVVGGSVLLIIHADGHISDWLNAPWKTQPVRQTQKCRTVLMQRHHFQGTIAQCCGRVAHFSTEGCVWKNARSIWNWAEFCGVMREDTIMVRNVLPGSFLTGMSALFNQPMMTMMMVTIIMTTTTPTIDIEPDPLFPTELSWSWNWIPGILFSFFLFIFLFIFISLSHNYFTLKDSLWVDTDADAKIVLIGHKQQW